MLLQMVERNSERKRVHVVYVIDRRNQMESIVSLETENKVLRVTQRIADRRVEE